MSGMLLRLAGPLQSWGEHAAFNVRDTLAFPTRSGLIGMFAAARGQSRHTALQAYDALSFTIRVDRPGRILGDFHTVGGGQSNRNQTLPLGGGGRRPMDTATLVTRRQYLTDAVFTVAVEAPDTLIGELATALDHPVWALYLGRRSCPPTEPLVLRRVTDDPVHELLHRAPLTPERPPNPTDQHVTATFYWDRAPSSQDTDPTPTYEVSDVPESFAPRSRRYRTRPVWRTEESLDAGLCAGPDPMDALVFYAEGTHA